MKYYPNLGSAIADKIVDDAAYENSNMLDQFMIDQVNSVKTAIRELEVNVANAISIRNNKINEIRELPEGEYKQKAVEAFKAIDDGGWFTPSFESRIVGLQKIAEILGVEADLPGVQTMGIFPLAAIPTAAWVAAVSALGIIAASATYFATQGARYAALVINPDINDPTATTAFAESLGGGAKTALIIGAIGAVAYFMLVHKKNA